MNLNNLKLIEKYQHLSRNQESQKFLENPLLHKDVWYTVDDLGLKILEHHKNLTLNFEDFYQNWFKLLVKLYTLVVARPGTVVSNICSSLSQLKKFSKFLEGQSVYSPEQINSQVFESFDYYLRAKKLQQNTISLHHRSLANFFDVCRSEGWLDVNTHWFQGKRKQVYSENNEINYLPEEVWNQLDKNLHYLPESVQRMVLVIRTIGIRVGELCNMPFDCLRKRGGKWHIRFMTEKYEIEDELPLVTPELVAVIREQQKYIRKHLDETYNRLFCGSSWIRKGSKKGIDKMLFKPKPQIMSSASFNLWLNRLAKKGDIRSQDGKLWHFQSHQFRRTVATVMANAGVRDLIIMKYLRHRSLDMQRYYTHILKQVLRDEFEEVLREKEYVDITGKVVIYHKIKNPVTESLRRKMQQITTQYGECYRPNIKAPCPTINACLRCQHWHTSTDDLPYLKDDLKRVEEEIQIAERMAMLRQKQGLEGDRNSLVNCIKGLELINA